MRALAAALAILLVAVHLPFADAQGTPRAVHVVVYHAYPDFRDGAPDADPMSTPLAAGPSASRLPLTLFDRTLQGEPAPEGDPESIPAHFRDMQRLVLARERSGAPFALEVSGRAEADAWVVEARALDAVDDGANGSLTLSAVVVEDGVVHEGASGVRVHRFVARLSLESVEGANASWRVPMDAAWDAQNLAVVAFASAPSGEVLQSARWDVATGETSVQRAKAVLVEHVTASWCVPCGPSDEALALIAAQFGGDALDASGGLAYARAPGAWTLVGGAAGLAAAALILRRRAA